MIAVTVFRSILNQMEYHLVQNRKENTHYDHVPFNLKGNGILVLSVQANLHSISFGQRYAYSTPPLSGLLSQNTPGIISKYWYF